MKEYFSLVVSAAVLAGVAECAAPETWKKYLGIVTGIMMISVILQPVSSIKKVDLFSDYNNEAINFETVQTQAVVSELSKKISSDVEEKIYNKTGVETEAETVISVSKDGIISGVKEIVVWTTEQQQLITQILEEYKPSKIYFREQKNF